MTGADPVRDSKNRGPGPDDPQTVVKNASDLGKVLRVVTPGGTMVDHRDVGHVSVEGDWVRLTEGRDESKIVHRDAVVSLAEWVGGESYWIVDEENSLFNTGETDGA